MTVKELNEKLWFQIAWKAIGVGFVAALGYLSHGETPALCLDSPFSMRLLINGSTNDYERLILTEDATLGQAQSGFKFLRLRQAFSAFQIDPVGVVVVQDLKQSNRGKILDGISIITSAEADEPFQWNGHEADQRFREWYDHKLTGMRRVYLDGCELTYKLDRHGRSIPTSFRWLRRTH